MIFDAETHTYAIEGKKLKSVSEWVDQFVPEFPAEKIAELCAKKEGKTIDEILAKWKQKSDISLHLGNWTHGSIEYYLKYDKEFTNEPIEAFKKHKTKNKYYSETIVYDDKYAGTIDLIESISKGKVKIHDFKTNGDLYKANGKLKKPFNHLENSPINKYTLQLNKYRELLEKMKGVDVIEMNLWHYQKGQFSIIKINKIKLCQN